MPTPSKSAKTRPAAADGDAELRAIARRERLALWRAVEAQHLIATRKLVDTLAEQALLEDLLDAAKPPLPDACAGLHYLLATPFRYPSAQYGSRFRAYTDPGVWYGADALRTSCAEVGYWRCRFIADSSGLQRLDGIAHTLFQARVAGPAIDLRQAPLVADFAQWTHAQDYTACQHLARRARSADIGIIRYASVRDPDAGACAAVLDAQMFRSAGGIRQQQTWFLSADATRACWQRSATARAEAFEFVYA